MTAAIRSRRCSGTLAGAVAGGLLAIGAGPAAAQMDAADRTAPAADERRTGGQPEHASLEAAAGEIAARAGRIEEELAALDQAELADDHWARQWAGEYYVGDGLGMNVRVLIAPEGGVTYTWHGCMGLYDGNHGTIAGTLDLDDDGAADGLKIDWGLNRAGGYGYDAVNWYFVRWDGPDGEPARRYFVPESKMMDMVNNFNEGGYARDGMYSAPLKREGERPGWRADRRPVVGAPRLPARWQSLLRLKPVDATITEVTRGRVVGGSAHARIRIDKGRADGLYRGLEVSLPGAGGATLSVDTLEEHSAVCLYQAYRFDGEDAILPQVGETVRVLEGAEGDK